MIDHILFTNDELCLKRVQIVFANTLPQYCKQENVHPNTGVFESQLGIFLCDRLTDKIPDVVKPIICISKVYLQLLLSQCIIQTLVLQRQDPGGNEDSVGSVWSWF